MLGQVRQVEAQTDSGPGPAAQDEPQKAKPTAAAASAHPERTELRFESATIIDAQREQDLIQAGDLIAAPAEDLRAPVRLRLTVSGGRSGQQLRAGVWFRRPAGPGWSPQDPVIVSPEGQAEFDLSPVPPGSHDIRLLAWATDPGPTLAAMTLPTLTVHQEEEATGT
jgi:hypothetical protein